MPRSDDDRDDDYRDDDRPRSRRRDEDDDRRSPRRDDDRRSRRRDEDDRRDDDRRPRYRDEDDRRSRPKTMSVLGLLSLIGGILSLLFSFIPCIGALGIVGGVIGLLLGAIGLRLAKSSNHGKGLPVSGIVVNLLSILVAGVWILLIANARRDATLDEVATADAIQISAAQLCREYDTNVVKADETYKGKVLEVTGQVKLVSKERIGRITVEIGNQNDTIDCDFGSATKEDLAGIEVGQTVTIRGKCKGIDRRSDYVVLESCKRVKDAPTAVAPGGPAAGAVKVEAAKLSAEFDADPAAANKTYRGKTVEITGTASEVDDDDKAELVIRFRSPKGPPVECRLTPEATKAAGPVRLGQRLTLRGTLARYDAEDDDAVLLENAVVVRAADGPAAKAEPPAPRPAPADDLAGLVEKLKTGDKAAAAAGLEKLGPKALPAVPELLKVLDAEDAAVRTAAAKAIVAIGRQPVSAVLDFYAGWCPPCRTMKPITDRLIAEGLPIVVIDIDRHPEVTEKFNVQSVPTYVALKGDEQVGRVTGETPEQNLRNLAAKAGPPAGAVAPGLDTPAAMAALFAVVLGLGDEDPWARFRAEAALRANRQSAAALAALLEGKYPARVRSGAVHGLLVAGSAKDMPEPARKALTAVLADEKQPADVRGYAALALGAGNSPPPAVAPALVSALGESQSADLRARAAARLGELKPPAGVPVLARAVKDAAGPVRAEAVKALGKYGPAAVPALPDLLAAKVDDRDGALRDAITKISQSADAVPVLAKALGHESDAVRLLAVEVLAEAADPAPAADALVTALADKNPGVRVRAAAVLQQIGGHEKAVLPVLVNALGARDESGDVYSALGEMGRRAAPELAKVVTGKDRRTTARVRAAMMLSNMRPPAAAVADLTAALRSDDLTVKACAALALARPRYNDEAAPTDPAVVAALIAGLKSQDKELRGSCLRSLGSAKHPDAVEPLLAALGGREDEDRFSAAGALAQYELDEKAADRVLALLKRKPTRPAAASALMATARKNPKVLQALVDAYAAAGTDEDRGSVGSSLAFAGQPAVAALARLAADPARPTALRVNALQLLARGIHESAKDTGPAVAGLLKDPDKAVRRQAAITLALAAGDAAAVPVLIEALGSDDAEARDEVVLALGRLGSKGAPAADRLIELLKAAAPDDRYELALAVGQVTQGTDKGVPALLTLLKADVSDQDRRFAAEAFRSVGKSAVPPLVKALSDDTYARAAVIRALAGCPEAGAAAAPLAKLLADKDPTVRFAAAAALARIDPKADGPVPVLIEAVRAAGPDQRYEFLAALERSGPATKAHLPEVIKLLDDPQARGSIAGLLADLGPDAAPAVGPLTKMLPTRDGVMAAEALERIGPKAASAVPALLKQLDRENSIGWAAETLGALGEAGRPAVPILLKKLDDPDLRLSALRALGPVAGLDRPAVQAALTKYAADPDPECRAAALAGLAGSKAGAAVPTLTKAIGDPDPDVRAAAVAALGQVGPAAAPAVPALTALVQGKDDRLRAAAAGALGGIGPGAEAAVPALVAALDDKKAVWAAAHALGRIGPKAAPAVPKLIALLDTDRVGYVATVALGEIGPAAKDALPKLRKLLEKPPGRPDEDGEPPVAAAIAKIEGKKK